MNIPSIQPLDQKIRNRIFFSLYAAVFSTMIGVGIVIPLLPRYVVTLGATGFWIGAIFSSFALSRALFLPLFGKLSDTHGRRRLILLGLSAYALISALYVLIGSVFEITVLRFLHGIASAMVLPVAIAYISDISSIGEEGKNIGSFASSIYLGLGFGPVIGGVISDFFTMNMVFLSMSGLSLMALVTTVVFLPDIPPKHVVKTPIRSLIFHEKLRGPALYQLMYAFANGTFMVFIPVIAVYQGCLNASEIGIVILVSVLSTTVFQHFFSRFADRFIKYHLISAGAGMIGLSLLFVPEFQGLIPYLCFAILMGIGRGISLPAMYGLVAVAGREIGQGSASGMVSTILAVGLIVSPLISGVVMDYAGLPAVFGMAGVISILCTGVFIRMDRSIS